MTGKKHPVLSRLGVVLLTAAMLAGCGMVSSLSPSSSPSQPAAPEAPPAPQYLDLSPVAPPAAKPEQKPMYDLRTQAWRPGYWLPDHGQFTWVPGDVVSKPSFTAVWSPDRWEKRKYGWAFIRGYWQ